MKIIRIDIQEPEERINLVSGLLHAGKKVWIKNIPQGDCYGIKVRGTVYFEIEDEFIKSVYAEQALAELPAEPDFITEEVIDSSNNLHVSRYPKNIKVSQLEGFRFHWQHDYNHLVLLKELRHF